MTSTKVRDMVGRCGLPWVWRWRARGCSRGERSPLSPLYRSRDPVYRSTHSYPPRRSRWKVIAALHQRAAAIEVDTTLVAGAARQAQQTAR